MSRETRDSKLTSHCRAIDTSVEPFVSIILLNWHGADDTIACLRSLKYMAYPNYQVIVVDNASKDDSVERIKGAFPNQRIINTSENLGFSGGCNVGMRVALKEGADYVWLLNNDTKVAENTLKTMIEVAEADSRTGAVGSVLYDMGRTDTILAWGGGKVNLWTGRARHVYKASTLDYLTGASLLLRSTALDEIGLLDDTYFMYWEDADFGFRLRRAGWSLAVAEDSRVWHAESSSVGMESPKQIAYFSRSAARFFRQYAHLGFVAVWLGAGRRIAKMLLKGRFSSAKIIFRETMRH